MYICIDFMQYISCYDWASSGDQIQSLPRKREDKMDIVEFGSYVYTYIFFLYNNQFMLIAYMKLICLAQIWGLKKSGL